MIDNGLFEPFPKMARLNRDVTVTEKIDGTNAQVIIVAADHLPLTGDFAHLQSTCIATIDNLSVFAGSRKRLITPGDDNYGFAAWVRGHADELVELGVGRHFGEWWGKSIQRGYGLDRRVFSLFNTKRWTDDNTPGCVSVVPTLWEGNYHLLDVDLVCDILRVDGSSAAPGYPNPEGVVVYHHAANITFKVTLENDAEPKSMAPRRAA